MHCINCLMAAVTSTITVQFHTACQIKLKQKGKTAFNCKKCECIYNCNDIETKTIAIALIPFYEKYYYILSSFYS